MKIAIAQLENLRNIEKYLARKGEDYEALVLGEYVCNHFFKDYLNLPNWREALSAEFAQLEPYLCDLSAKFKKTIIAPIIEARGDKILKSIMLVREGVGVFYRARRLMNYAHWDEAAFFDNEAANLAGDFADSPKDSPNLADSPDSPRKNSANPKAANLANPANPKNPAPRATHISTTPHALSALSISSAPLIPGAPLIFELGDLKAAVLFGFEAHFDELWLELKNAAVDVVFLPTASTFGSNLRWQKILTVRSFLNAAFVVRVNRIGGFLEQDARRESVWKFYGESFVALPDGEVGDILVEDYERFLVCDLRKSDIVAARQDWRFR